LSQGDHRVGVQLFGEVHHSVRTILLVTWASRSEKGTEGLDRELVTLLATSRRVLVTKKHEVSTRGYLQHKQYKLTQAVSHLVVDAEMTWAMRLLKREGAAVTDPAAEKARRNVNN
jgi:hypothetical protein